MLNLLYKPVTPWAKANQIQIFINRVLGKIANLLYPIWIRINPLPKTQAKKGKDDYVISLTSFPARINKVHLCIESLLRQSTKADRIILWLAESQFPNKNIPRQLRELENKGLEIRYCDDLRSYKKIFYTAQEFNQTNIITVDDDTLYPENWLERLIETANMNPGCVACYRAHKITFNGGEPAPYDEWIGLSPDFSGPSLLLIAIGVGGILYPKGFFENVVFDYNIIKELAPLSDDLWLKIIGYTQNVPVVKVDENSKEWFTIATSQKKALLQDNVYKKENDIAFRNLCNYYHVKW